MRWPPSPPTWPPRACALGSLTCTCTPRTCCGGPARTGRAAASVRFRPLPPPFAGRARVSPPGASAAGSRDAGLALAGPRRWSNRRLDVAPLLEDLGRPLIAVAHHHEDDRRDQARAAADHQDDPDHLQVDVLRGPGDGEAQDRADQDEEDAAASAQRDQPPFTWAAWRYPAASWPCSRTTQRNPRCAVEVS